MQGFETARTPALRFGAGRITGLGGWLASRGLPDAVVVFSRSALADPETRAGVVENLSGADIRAEFFRYDRLPDAQGAFDADRGDYTEASPDIVDAIVESAGRTPSAVVAIGGGSALDTGKALAAAFVEPGSIVDYLEGVGSKTPSGRSLPFVAVPTTAGTGSEATKNAVLSRVGPEGFKKSLRHDNYIPDLAIVDPLLQLGCPARLTAASGLDAITQLLEALVSTGASPLTDALALDGLAAAGRGFLRAVERGQADVDARGDMAYAAYLSGVCLANAGLGTVHGLAGAAGAATAVPHGLFCGVMLPIVVQRTANALSRRRDSLAALGKYAAAGTALTGRNGGSLEDRIGALVARIGEFVRVGDLGSLSAWGFDQETIARVAGESGNKNNPYQFTLEERVELLEDAL